MLMASLRRNVASWLALLLGTLGCKWALAEETLAVDADARQRASHHFERGSELAQRADYEAAAIEFHRAYDMHPEPSVLFNLGQAYIASGQPLEAYDALAEFLKRSDEKVQSGRRRAAEHLMTVAEGRIGQLWIEVEAPGAVIEVDGRSVGTAPLDRYLRLPAGAHAVVVRAAQQTRVTNVTVRARDQQQIFIGSEPSRPQEPALLLFSCALPGVRVWVDGLDRGTSLRAGFLLVPSGSHSLTLQRPGYLTESATFRLLPGQSHRHRCEGRIDPVLDASQVGTLFLSQLPSWAEATIFVDGRPSRTGALTLPSGPHDVEVRGRNSELWVRSIHLDRGTTIDVRPKLTPTREHVRATTHSMDRRRFWSVASLGTGVAFIATAVTLSWVRSDEHEAWSKERDALNQGDVPAEEVARRLYANSRKALELQTIEHAMWGAAVLGSASVALSAYLWLTAVDIPGNGELGAEASRSGGSIRYMGVF